MCVGALLESDVEALVYAVPNIVDGAAGTVIQLAQHPGLRRRLQVVSGIRQAEAEELFATHRAREPRRRRARRRPARRGARGSGLSRFGILPDGEVSEWLKVPLSKSGVRKHRGFESHPLRQHSPDRSVRFAADDGRRRDGRFWRGRLVAYGAALEMRFGATRRGFESPPLRHASGWLGRCPCYHSGAVLGGELAVPCTCNPLQQG